MRKKTKIVVISDLHPDVVTMGVPRFSEVSQALDAAVTHAIEIKANAFVFAGDLVDPDSGGATFQAIAMMIRAVRRLTERGIHTVLLAGNHDVCEDGSGATVLTPLAALDLNYLFVMETPSVVRVSPDVVILGLPFMAASNGVDMPMATKNLWNAVDKDHKVVVVGHLSVPGIIPGEETKELPRGREVVFPFEETKRAAVRINGHYHRRQTFDPGDGGPPIIVPGSAARLTFGEEDHTPSFLELEV